MAQSRLLSTAPASSHIVGEEIQLSMPWGHVSALAFGPQDGRPLLGIHGWLDNANSFLGLAASLPPDVRFVAIDLPGHGFSSHLPAGCEYFFMEWVIYIARPFSGAVSLQ
jgi:pimeloyl-ACP methyl ester carboxylesterase